MDFFVHSDLELRQGKPEVMLKLQPWKCVNRHTNMSEVNIFYKANTRIVPP